MQKARRFLNGEISTMVEASDETESDEESDEHKSSEVSEEKKHSED